MLRSRCSGYLALSKWTFYGSISKASIVFEVVSMAEFTLCSDSKLENRRRPTPRTTVIVGGCRVTLCSVFADCLILNVLGTTSIPQRNHKSLQPSIERVTPRPIASIELPISMVRDVHEDANRRCFFRLR